MLARGEKISYLSDDRIGIVFRECGNPDQIAYRMGSLGCGMGTNARKIEHFPPSRHLWERKDTVFKGQEDGFFAGCHGLSPDKLLVVLPALAGRHDADVISLTRPPVNTPYLSCIIVLLRLPHTVLSMCLI